MDAYLIGEMLFEGIGAYTPWLPTQGNAGVFAVEILGISGLTMTVTVQTKKRDDTDESGNISEPGSISSITTSGVKTSTALSNFKDVYRLKISTGATPAMDWVLFRILQASWLTN